MNGQGRFGTWEAAVTWLRQQPDRAALVRDAYYDDPVEGAADRYWRGEEWAALRSILSGRQGRALDVGAGRGIASYALARDGFAVIALEPDPSDLVGAGAIRRLAAASAMPIEVCEQYSESLPFAESSFDLVFARAVLHHSRDLATACREFHRVLRPGGLLVAVREHVISRPEDLPAFLAAHPLHSLYGGEHAYLLKEYRGALRSAGFCTVRELGPLESSINYAPTTAASLRSQIALKLTGGFGPATRFVRVLLSVGKIWEAAVPVMQLVDNRPGRLYSFIAERAL